MTKKAWYEIGQIYKEPPKPKTRGRDAAFTLPTPQRTLTEGAHYWPPEALPFAYAWACIEIALLCSQEASAAYYEAVRTLELPGCQALLRNAIAERSNTQKGIGKFFKSIEKGSVLPILRLNTDRQYEYDTDYQLYIERISEFVRVSFNRQVDRDNERHKVMAEKARFLFSAVVIRTIAEHCKVKLENWNKYRPDDIDSIMTSNPTTRPERLKKSDIRQIYKRYKWALRHNAKLIKDAGQWYKCRVNPGSITDFLNELADQNPPIILERARISLDLAPYDEVTGYPRKWRK